MLFGASDGTIVSLAWWTGAASFLITFIMLLGILTARFAFLANQLREKRFVSRWRPFFIGAVAEDPKKAPALEERNRLMFLQLYIHFQSLVKGEERVRINRLARMSGARPYALQLLDAGAMRHRIVAASALGYMCLKDALAPLEKGLDSENTVFSIATAFALVRIEPALGAHLVLERAVSRHDWPPSIVDRLLIEAGKEAVSPVLKKLVLSADEEHAPLYLKLLTAADSPTAEAIESHWVKNAKKSETLSAVLQIVKNPRHLQWVRGLMNHPAWFVRVQAIGALGRIGGAEDVQRLMALLVNPEWWVRYRAAKALTGLPGVTIDELRNMSAGQKDPYAREILERVAVEAMVEAR